MKLKHYGTAHLKQAELRRAAKHLATYLKLLNEVYKTKAGNLHESSINLVRDPELLKTLKTLVREKGGKKLKYIIVAGIGGSNLGTKAVYDALFGFFDVLEPNRFPKIIFADTTHPEILKKLHKLVTHDIKSADEILLNIISKSGGTTETAANTEVILDMLRRKIKFPLDRLVVTTDEGSKLWNLAKEKNVALLEIPKPVGGRFSVFSAVGLFPLLLSGIDIGALLGGANVVLKKCLSNELSNPALISAATLQKNYAMGKNIFDSFIFNPELESLGKWYRQLLGESIGKEENQKGDLVNIGITPTVSIGSTDLHSVGQLYLGGPKDKFTAFISAEKSNSDVKTPEKFTFPVVQGITGISVQKIRNAILNGVKAAYRKKNLPYLEIKLPDISAGSIGEFMQFKMIEIMFLGNLLGVNAFDQPNVELYKTETKRLLK